jgi:hypothetical protein
MKPYVVRQGDYLTKLAHTMGFNPDSVWAHPKNEALRNKRTDPDMLQPGDLLYVPDEARERLPIEPGTINAYVARIPRMPVAVKLQVGGAPLSKERYRILGLGPDPIAGATDEDGYLRTEVAVHVREIEVQLVDRKRTLRVRVGNMDPINELAGLQKRLQHLGFYQATRGGSENFEAKDPPAVKAALAAFQSSRKLPATGHLDDDTRAALIAAHGS